MNSSDADLFFEAVAAWNQRGRLADLLPPLLGELIRAIGAERVIFLTVDRRGSYRVITIDDGLGNIATKFSVAVRSTDALDRVD